MSLYQKFATDPNLETGAGVTLDYGDVKITIHRAGNMNRAYQKALTDKIKPYARMLLAGNLDADKSNQLMAEVYADTIIKGWEGVTDAKGKTLPFTRENVIKLLTDLPDFFVKLQAEADDITNFRKAEIEADAKNSVKS